MREFFGRFPSLFTIGEPFEVSNAPLQDCGDGWDWCLPEGLHWWVGNPLLEVWSGEWEPIEPLEVHHRSGVVSFQRCLEGRSVRGSGACHPTSLLSCSATWNLTFAQVTQMAPVHGGGHATQNYRGGSSVFLDGVAVDPQGENVLAVLPFSVGSFFGVGRIVGGVKGVTVFFNDEGVVYEPARS